MLGYVCEGLLQEEIVKEATLIRRRFGPIGLLEIGASALPSRTIFVLYFSSTAYQPDTIASSTLHGAKPKKSYKSLHHALSLRQIKVQNTLPKVRF